MNRESMKPEPAVTLRASAEGDIQKLDILENEKIVGGIKFTEDNDTKEVTLLNYYVNPKGRGLGTAALRALLSAYPHHTIFASVEAQNAESIRAMEKAGFVRIHAAAGTLTYRSRKVE